MTSKKYHQIVCLLSPHWSVESVQTAHGTTHAFSLDLLADCQSFTPPQIWLDNFQLYDWSYNLLWQFCIPAALPVWLLNCVLSGEIKQTLELWGTERGCQIDQTQVSVCNDVALGPGKGFMLHSDQNCPGIPALLDSRTGTAPVEGTHTHIHTHHLIWISICWSVYC